MLPLASLETPAPGAAPGGGRLPDFLVIGAMKAATTSLGAYLDAHPQARCGPEAHFFCCHYDRGVDWYRAQFAGTDGVAAVGEKTPHYLHVPRAVERMADLLPGARLIAILRDPVDRALSHYWHERRHGRETLDVRQAFDAEREAAGAGRTRFGYEERGLYLEQLTRVLGRYPREMLHVLLFEDLRDAPAAAFSDVCRFLGIDDTVQPAALGEAANPYREHRPAWLWHAMFRYRLWRRLPRPAAEALGRWMTREAEYPPMDQDLRRRLAERFAAENDALATWLGRDLSHWTRS